MQHKMNRISITADGRFNELREASTEK